MASYFDVLWFYMAVCVIDVCGGGFGVWVIVGLRFVGLRIAVIGGRMCFRDFAWFRLWIVLCVGCVVVSWCC